MLLWFVGTAVTAVVAVFGDPRFDHRLLVVGAVLPPLVDVWSGGAWIMHSVITSVALLVVVMLATIGRRDARRRWLALPLGTLLHLVFTGAWSDPAVFWWPLGGWTLDAPLPVVERGWWNVPLEVIGALLLVRIWRHAGLSDPHARRRFRATGQLSLASSPTARGS